MCRAPGRGSELLRRDPGCELGAAGDETRRGAGARLARPWPSQQDVWSEAAHLGASLVSSD